MLKNNYLNNLFLLFFLVNFLSFSQTAKKQDELSLNSGTIDSQFEYVIQKSGNWRDERGQNYEVIKSNWLSKLKSHTLDSLKAVKNELLTTQNTVKKQNNEIESLKNSLSSTKIELESTTEEKDSMSLFRIQMSKNSYKGLMWTIITILLVFLIFFIYKYKNSNSVTQEVKSKLIELEEGFEEHRRNALEREQKVRRQLQDEINKKRNI